jgi:hypothetical protein
MATLDIGGRSVTVDDSFLSMSPEQQNAAVEEIAATLGPAFSMSRAVTDIPSEMKRTAGEHLGNIDKGLLNNPQKSASGGLLDTGKGVLSIPMLALDTAIGAPARSVLGHTLANASHQAGQVINPEVAARDNPNEMYEAFRPGVDQAMAAVAPRAASPVGARSVPATVPTAAELKKAAVDVWQSPSIQNMQIPPGDVARLAQQLQNDILRRGFRPSAGSAPGTFAELQRMTPDPAVAGVSVDDMRAARRAFDMAAKQRDPIGQATPDAVAARSSIEGIDNFLDTLAPELRSANANYAAGKRAELLDYRAMKAKDRADKTGSGSNIENTIRQEIDKIGSRGLSPDEVSARDRIVHGTPTRNALRKVGKLGVSDGLSLLLHAGAAGTSGGLTIPVAAAGTAARKIGEMLTKRDIAALNKQLRLRSPLAQQLQALPPKQASKVTKSLISALLAGIPARQPAFSGLVPAYADQNKQ